MARLQLSERYACVYTCKDKFSSSGSEQVTCSNIVYTAVIDADESEEIDGTGGSSSRTTASQLDRVEHQYKIC